MGLTATARGLTRKTGVDCGYITFGAFRQKLAETYNPRLGEIYSKWCHESISEEEAREWEQLCGEGLHIFLTHSDGDGSFTPQECRKIYEDIKDLHMDMWGHNYIVMEPYNILEHWKAIFLHCARRRVKLWFS